MSNTDAKVDIEFGFDQFTNQSQLSVKVSFPNAGVDRPDAGGYSLSATAANRKLVYRLKQAIEDGVGWPERRITVDVNGKSYVACKHNLMGRYLNTDLRRLGY